jgi:hypothetical protein
LNHTLEDFDMLVVNIVGLMPDGSYQAIRIDDVPSDYIECSCTGEYLPRSEFGLKVLDDDYTRISRTNGLRSYNMSWDDYQATKLALPSVKNSREYLSMKGVLRSRQHMLSNTMKIRDMIEALQKLNPDDLICITQHGYYADGNRADIFEPVKEGSIDINLDGSVIRTVYSIGDSSQSY